jgi:hypothetical protein
VEKSKQIAGLIGPVIAVLAVTEAFNLPIWRGVAPPVVYLAGTVLFVAGLSIVRAHNRWTLSWPVIVTTAGWIGVLGGLYRMCAPMAPQAPERPATYFGLGLMFLAGGFLTYKAYSRPDGPQR